MIGLPGRRVLGVSGVLLLALGAFALMSWHGRVPGHGNGNGDGDALSQLPLVRSLRCAYAGVARRPDGVLTVRYRHVGGDDPATDLELVLAASGELTLATAAQPVPQRIATDRGAVGLLRERIEAQALRCVETVPRFARHPAVAGRDSLEIEVGASRQVLSVDRCHGVSDARAFFAVVDDLTALAPPAAVLLAGRPPVAAPIVAGACDDATLAEVEARATRWRPGEPSRGPRSPPDR